MVNLTIIEATNTSKQQRITAYNQHKSKILKQQIRHLNESKHILIQTNHSSKPKPDKTTHRPHNPQTQ